MAKWVGRAAWFITNCLVGLLWLSLLAWLIGRVLTDRHAWSQWLWWIPTPAALIAAALGLLLAFRRARLPRLRRRRIVIWAACGFAIALHFTIVEQRFLHPTPTAPSGALTIAHWNTTVGERGREQAMLDAADALDADLLLLTTPPGTVRQALYDQGVATEGGTGFLNLYPVCVRSRLPIMHTRVLVATDLIFITLLEIDATERVGRPVVIYLVDLPSKPGRSRMEIAREGRRLLDELDAPAPDVAVGDFNIPRDSASIAVLFPGMTDAYDVAGHGYGATFPRRLPLYHIDHVLLRDASGLRAARYDIVDESQSRHLAQKAWIVADE